MCKSFGILARPLTTNEKNALLFFGGFVSLHIRSLFAACRRRGRKKRKRIWRFLYLDIPHSSHGLITHISQARGKSMRSVCHSETLHPPGLPFRSVFSAGPKSQRRSQGLLCPSRFSPFQKPLKRHKRKDFIYNGLEAAVRWIDCTGRVESNNRTTEQRLSSFQIIISVPPHLLNSSSNLFLVEHRSARHIVVPG